MYLTQQSLIALPKFNRRVTRPPLRYVPPDPTVRPKAEGGRIYGAQIRILAAFWVVGCSLLACAVGPKNENSHVIVFVNDSAGAPEQVVLTAERTAARIFQQAGVEVGWVNCGAMARSRSHAQCGDTDMSFGLVVRIIPHARTLGDDIFGVSFLDHQAGI